MNYILKYREPGNRPGTERWAKRKVESVPEAIAWMNKNQAIAFLPAFLETNACLPPLWAETPPLSQQQVVSRRINDSKK